MKNDYTYLSGKKTIEEVIYYSLPSTAGKTLRREDIEHWKVWLLKEGFVIEVVPGVWVFTDAGKLSVIECLEKRSNDIKK